MDDMNAKNENEDTSRADREQYILAARKLLETRSHQIDIRAVLRTQFGITDRDARKYLRLARAQILNYTDRQVDAHLADAFSFYLGIVRDRKQKLSDRIRAQDRIDRLLAQTADRANQSTERRETADQLKSRIELIGSYLFPLGLIEPHYPIEEHARVAAEILIQNGFAHATAHEEIQPAPGESAPTLTASGPSGPGHCTAAGNEESEPPHPRGA